MSDPIEGVDLDAAYGAIRMLSCPYYQGTGICGNACREEPVCRTDEPERGWLGQLRDAVGVPTGWEDRWKALRQTADWFSANLPDNHTVTVRSIRTEMDQIEARIPAEPDPIESGREARIGQWEERWAALRHYMAMPVGRFYAERMDQLEAEIPTGLPVGANWVPRVEGRITLQLEPERVTRLLELLETVDQDYVTQTYSDAQALAEDLRNMAERQAITDRKEPE